MSVAVLAPEPLDAAELQARTSLAYDAYLEQAKQDFLTRVRRGGAESPSGREILRAGPAKEDGIVAVPGGLVHHWVATAFVRGATLREALQVSSDFSAYHQVYRAVIASSVLQRAGDTYDVVMRVKEGEAGISAVFQITSTIQYVFPDSRSAYALSHAREIREVKNAGARDERLLPAGRDSGYLWRANTFARFIEHADGVFVETETLGLSRQFPPWLGWFIEPIARRVGRRSAAASLQDFLAALHTRRRPTVQSHSVFTRRARERHGDCVNALHVVHARAAMRVHGIRRVPPANARSTYADHRSALAPMHRSPSRGWHAIVVVGDAARFTA